MPTVLPEHRPRDLQRAGVGRSVWMLACGVLRRLTVALAAERRALRAIRELESFDDHRLRDLGLTRLTIERAVRFGREPESDVPRSAAGPDRLAAA
jgi:uncharacterized protein YjiS (DUF1127 family)